MLLLLISFNYFGCEDRCLCSSKPNKTQEANSVILEGRESSTRAKMHRALLLILESLHEALFLSLSDPNGSNMPKLYSSMKTYILFDFV